ncbi:MAG: FAD-dependent oxidoreductase [Patescibacteria group bacterium]
MVTKNQHIEFIVRRLEPETPNHSSIFFHRPAHFDFEAGDWMDIEFDGLRLKGGITYSMSSSPTEDDIRITFREGLSDFKRALQNVQPGERLHIVQYGNDYDFKLNMNQDSVLIAGGVGVAPFRSMLKQMYDNRLSNTVKLIYLNQNDDYLFKSELDEWSMLLPNLSVVYIPTKEIGRKKREKVIRSMIKDTRQNFYISGPPGMVEANEHLLIDMGVAVRDIRIDSFGGY